MVNRKKVQYVVARVRQREQQPVVKVPPYRQIDPLRAKLKVAKRVVKVVEVRTLQRHRVLRDAPPRWTKKRVVKR